MDLFKVPGANLVGLSKFKFDEIKNAIDDCLNDYLIKPDVAANMKCSDLFNSTQNREVSTKTIILTLRLLETLVYNGNSRFYMVLNDERFLRELGNVARKYSKLLGSQNKEVSDLVLDIIQSWGEGFLPKRKEYPNIPELYFQLRKEGLPFKTQQFDPNRVPIFSNDNSKVNYMDKETDGILAATLQSSMNDRKNPPIRADPSGQNSTESIIESLSTSSELLKNVITSSKSFHEVLSNDLTEELVDQIETFQSKMGLFIEAGLETGDEHLEALFKLNEDSQVLTSNFFKMKRKEILFEEAKNKISGLNFSLNTRNEAAVENSKDTKISNLIDTEDFFSSSATSNLPSSSSQKNPLNHASPIDFDPFQMNKTESQNNFDPFNINNSQASGQAPNSTIPHTIHGQNEQSGQKITNENQRIVKILPPPPSSSNLSTGPPKNKPITPLIPPPSDTNTYRRPSASSNGNINLLETPSNSSNGTATTLNTPANHNPPQTTTDDLLDIFGTFSLQASQANNVSSQTTNDSKQNDFFSAQNPNIQSPSLASINSLSNGLMNHPTNPSVPINSGIGYNLQPPANINHRSGLQAHSSLPTSSNTNMFYNQPNYSTGLTSNEPNYPNSMNHPPINNMNSNENPANQKATIDPSNPFDLFG